MPLPVSGDWKLTFGEEFNGTAINTNVWGTNWLGAPGVITKPVATEELGAYDPAMVSVSNGALHLRTVASPVTVNGINYDYRGGIVQTHDSFSQTYGYFEARIKLQGTNGKIDNWPAFWLNGKDWPTTGELDVMEGLGGDAAYHYHSPSGGPGKSVPGDYTGWHVFGALWEPGKVSYYYDNQLVGTISDGITNAPQYLILNLGIGRESIRSPASEMQVDWVRAYSRNPNDPAPVTAPFDQLLTGTNANDVLKGGNSNDQIQGLGGADKLTGNAGNDKMTGGTGNDSLAGSAGADRLHGGTGNDKISGSQGMDWLFGSAGADSLSGGVDADLFVFTTIADSSPGQGARDSIHDFRHADGDRISLSSIDANTAVAGDQAFKFIGNLPFSHHAGELRYAKQATTSTLYADVNGDGRADFALQLRGVSTLLDADLVL